MSRNRTELITKKQKIMNISKQLDERETMHIPLCFKYTGNPGHLVLTWATENSRKLARLATKHWS